MSSAAIDPSDALGQALHRRGDPMSARDFLDVLDEVGTVSSGPLTQGERDFLLEHTDLTSDDLTDSARRATRIEVSRSRLAVNHSVLDRALKTSDVAKLLGRAEANVRRSRLSGDLYSINPGDPSGLRFPRWQFTDAGQAVPGLRRIIPTFPRNMHPLAVEHFMTTANEALEGQAPVQWLAGGGPVEAVMELVDELGYM